MSGLLLDPFGVDDELDLVADDNAAGLEREVPLEAPLFAAHFGLGAEADAGVAPRGSLRSEVLTLERDRAGHAADSEITVQDEFAVAVVFDVGRRERRVPVLFGVEEVGRAQVLISLRVSAL